MALSWGGTVTPLRSLEMHYRSRGASFWEKALGRADSSQVIAYGSGGSERLVLSVLDLPMTGGGGQGFWGILMTPAVVQADPSSITHRR